MRVKEVKKLTRKNILNLKKGDEILFSGFMYTARDQAHQRLVKLIEKNKKLPFSVSGEIFYYCGPTATRPGKVIGSCGPTTSQRMDSFVKPLLGVGLLAMVGKGRRSKEVQTLIKKYQAIYFIAPSGCGALLSKSVVSKSTVAFPELGPEAIYRLEVNRFPLIVAIDSEGGSIYKNT